MTDVRQPRSKIYDGPIYGRLVEPMLAGVHGYVTKHLPAGERVLDACCGTGALARRMAASGRRVTGIDLSPRNIDYANQLVTGASDASPTYGVADVASLAVPSDGPYDVATVVLAIHEMPTEARISVLAALLRVARQVLVVDFVAPMPLSLAGMRNRFMEFSAGAEHFSAYRDYQSRGGLLPIVATVTGELEDRRQIDAATLEVVRLRGAPGPTPPV